MKNNLLSSSLLLLSLSCLLLASCSGGSKDSETKPVDTVSTDTSVTDTNNDTADLTAKYNPNLPGMDAGGDEFRFIYGDNDFEPNLDICAEEENGEPLNDAIYARNLAIEEKYNLKICWDRFEYGTAHNELAKTIKAGEDLYDVSINNGAYTLSLATQKQLQQLNDFPYIDFSKPYWNANMLDGSSINHKNYFAYSDINIHALGATPCVLFNKTVAEQFDFNGLYQDVENGTWTFDKMSEYIKAVTSDLDGDGKITEKDRLGFVGNTFVIDCFLSGTGYQTITKDADDMPILNIQSEPYYNIVAAIMDVCSADNGSYICDRYSGVDREYAPMEALEENRALFWIANLKGVERMRGMESPFGILPIPKLNDEQSSYKIHYQANIGGAMSVPTTAANTELIGMVLEDMSYESMRSVKPAYIDVLLQGKFLRDEESLVTLNIMFDSYYSDIGFMTGSSGITILSELRDIIANNRTDYVSRIEKKMKSYTKSLTKICNTYLEDPT